MKQKMWDHIRSCCVALMRNLVLTQARCTIQWPFTSQQGRSTLAALPRSAHRSGLITRCVGGLRITPVSGYHKLLGSSMSLGYSTH
jgi:hypothetical protein